jgi:hypothetical protein
LPGTQPTDKADKKTFGTLDDSSNISAGKFYLSKENWPLAGNLVYGLVSKRNGSYRNSDFILEIIKKYFLVKRVAIPFPFTTFM